MKLDSVWRIVQSLSHGEKRMIHASIKSKSTLPKYLELYQVLMHKQDLKSALVETQLRVSTSHLRNLTDELFHFLLSHLDRNKPQDAIQAYRWGIILLERNEINGGIQLLKKARKYASAYGDFQTAINAITEEQKYVLDVRKGSFLRKEEELLKEKADKLQSLISLRSRIDLSIKAKSSNDRIYLKSLKSTPILEKLPDLGFRGELEFLKIWAKITVYQGSYDAAIGYAQKLKSLLETEDTLLATEELISISTSLSRLYFVTGDLANARKTIFMLNGVQPQNKMLAARIFLNVTVTRLSWANTQGETEEAKAILEEATRIMPDFKDHLDPRLYQRFLFNAIHFQFIRGNFVACLRYVQEARQQPKIENTKTPTLIWVLIYELFSLISLRDWEVGLDAKIQSVSRQKEKEAIRFEMPNLALRFARMTLDKGLVQGKELQEWINETALLLTEPFEARAFLYFPFHDWLIQMQTGKSISLQIRERIALEKENQIDIKGQSGG